MTVILRYCAPFYEAPMYTFVFTEVMALVLELAKTARRLAVELVKFFGARNLGRLETVQGFIPYPLG